MIINCVKCRFGYIGILESQLMVSHRQVQFEEKSGVAQLVEELFDGGNRIAVLDRDSVEGLVLNAKSPGSIFLPNQQNGRREKAP